MKAIDLAMSARGKTVTFSGTIRQVIGNDNGAVDLVVDAPGGTARVFLDPAAAASLDIDVK